MERTRGSSGAEDRERRARLEALQVELREARARSGMSDSAALAAVEEALQRAEERVAEAEARLKMLHLEKEQLDRDEEWIEKERQEALVLERGAARRDEYLNWFPWRRKTWGGELVVMLVAVVGCVVAMALAFSTLGLWKMLMRH